MKQRPNRTTGWIPPVSPYGLIQETLWPNEWKILVSCILLNCTTRRSAEKIIPRLFENYPTPAAMSRANAGELSNIISGLGFGNRRARTLIDMSKEYCEGRWKHASDLPGIGSYAADAWEIFVCGKLPSTVPRDGALKNYYNWRLKHGL